MGIQDRIYSYSTAGVISVPKWLWHPLPPPSASCFLRKEEPLELGRSFFINALEQKSMQIAALDRSILRECTGILSSIFVVRICNTNNGQDLYTLLSTTLSLIEGFNQTLKQTTLTWKKYNKDAIKVMGRFDKNLDVTRTNIPLFSHCLRDNLPRVASVPKGRERGFWASEKHEGRARKEEGEPVPLLPSPSRPVLRLNSLPFPFERLPRRLPIIKLSYYHIF